MNIGVEIALIAVPGTMLALARDIWIRTRVEAKERLDRIDRIECERLDREQKADIAVVATVPAFLSLDETSAVRDLVRCQAKCKELEIEVVALREQAAHKSRGSFLGKGKSSDDSTKFS